MTKAIKPKKIPQIQDDFSKDLINENATGQEK